MSKVILDILGLGLLTLISCIAALVWQLKDMCAAKTDLTEALAAYEWSQVPDDEIDGSEVLENE